MNGRWLLAVAVAGVGLAWPATFHGSGEVRAAMAQDANAPAASQPGGEEPGLRKPKQAADLEKLLRARETPPLSPTPIDAPKRSGKTLGKGGVPLLPEGTAVVDRPGRLVRSGDRCEFSFHVDDSMSAPISMELLRNEFLELMEREAQSGATEFTISAEVTRYRDANYLLVRKVLRRVSNGNIAP